MIAFAAESWLKICTYLLLGVPTNWYFCDETPVLLFGLESVMPDGTEPVATT